MKRYYVVILILAAGIFASCSKDNNGSFLTPGSVFILQNNGADTLVQEVSILKDTIVVIGLHAALDGRSATQNHTVTFRIDSTRMNSFKNNYGDALLLPRESYYFYRPQVQIASGASVSDSVQINLVKQTNLKSETTYVLPLVINNVDGDREAMVMDQVFYLVVKTGKIPPTSKSNWTIAGYSSQLGANVATNVLDNDDQNTVWASSPGPMPQYLIINFGARISFSGVTYRTPTMYYTNASLGGYPTRVKIEVSDDATTWTDKGTYDGILGPETWTQSIGPTSAQYMKFSVLAAAPYANGAAELTLVGGIGLIP